VCVSGSEDGNVRLWDLRRLDEGDGHDGEREIVGLSDVVEEDEDAEKEGDGNTEVKPPNGIRPEIGKNTSVRNDSCARVLEGHSKAVTALYFEDGCLVGSSFFCENYCLSLRLLPRLREPPIKHCGNGILQLANA
jgi:mitochondrial division protein 1